MAIPDVVLPIIHLNGDRKSTLIGQLEAAADAIYTAHAALCECIPNPRNYSIADGLYGKAIVQHRTRHDHLQAVLDSLVAEVEGIEAAYPTTR